MEESILKSTKKILGLDADYTAFDTDVLTWINAACSTLRGLGVGNPDLYVDSDEQTWSQFEEDREDTSMIKTYVYLRTKIMFDPPQASHVMTAMQEQIKEQEFRLSVNREDRDYQPVNTTGRRGGRVYE